MRWGCHYGYDGLSQSRMYHDIPKKKYGWSGFPALKWPLSVWYPGIPDFSQPSQRCQDKASGSTVAPKKKTSPAPSWWSARCHLQTWHASRPVPWALDVVCALSWRYMAIGCYRSVVISCSSKKIKNTPLAQISTKTHRLGFFGY